MNRTRYRTRSQQITGQIYFLRKKREEKGLPFKAESRVSLVKMLRRPVEPSPFVFREGLMRRIWLTTFILLAAVRIADAAQWPVEIFERMDDKRIVVFLSDDDIETDPAWSPIEGGPPLTLAAVIQELNTWIKDNADLAGFDIHEIKLKGIPHHEVDRHWYYLVQLHKLVDGRPERRYAAVLMNGKLVPAIREPASVK
ncbi:hypothetical protein [Thiocapsa bogorovii]|uniref:hypothetical protein n=1 Tax=Thiocapsa bogorovii TaxID=521689 RepID=UPI001E476BEF|nr:hypothetical protein [Thiocapsa bogorovii]UHD17409.1 hypothetical protein LT988_05000 [Thiocapsa bogorovii]